MFYIKKKSSIFTQRFPVLCVIETESRKMDDYETIRQGCLRGDRGAQLNFYKCFCGFVYSSCLRVLGNAQEAEEVMQETFLKAFDTFHAYADTPVNDMERILKRIAVNRSIDRLRKRHFTFADLGEADSPSEDGEASEEDLAELQQEAIQSTLPLLPEGYRLVLTLYYAEEMTTAEIAERLRIAPSSVRSQCARAKQKLIELIKKNYRYEQLVG